LPIDKRNDTYIYYRTQMVLIYYDMSSR